jgi:hypothetical protein
VLEQLASQEHAPALNENLGEGYPKRRNASELRDAPLQSAAHRHDLLWQEQTAAEWEPDGNAFVYRELPGKNSLPDQCTQRKHEPVERTPRLGWMSTMSVNASIPAAQ